MGANAVEKANNLPKEDTTGIHFLHYLRKFRTFPPDGNGVDEGSSKRCPSLNKECWFSLYTCHVDGNGKQLSTSAHSHVQKKTQMFSNSILLQTDAYIETLFKLRAHDALSPARLVALRTGRTAPRQIPGGEARTAKESQ